MHRVVGKFIAPAALAAAVLAPGLAGAATQGTMGATSSGSIAVQAQVPSLVKLTGLTDLSFTTNSFPATAADTFCVYSNTSATYAVIVSSAEGSFLLNNAGSTASITYSVDWADTGGTTALTYNTKLTGQGTGAANPSCSGGTNASLTVTITETDLGTAPADIYSGTLNLTISPN